MAFWKMEGFVVTPTTPLPSMRSCRPPERSMSRLRSSSQTDTPDSASACTAAGLVGSVLTRSSLCVLDGGPGRLDDGRRSDAELRVEGGDVGGGREVVDAHALTGLADEVPPTEGG